MDIATYAAEADAEAEHWWFVGRRWLFSRELQMLGAKPGSHILDAGTSTGTNLRMLQDQGYQNYKGLDLSSEAVRYCTLKGLGEVRKGDVCQMPFESESFDFVLATDILEHVENDIAALKEINRVLKPGGSALITVPAFPSLWGLQDEVAHHKRRYRLGPLLDRTCQSGFVVGRRYHFNYLLFAPIWIVRQIIRILDIKVSSENEINTPHLNALLGFIFMLDIRTAPWLRLPFGVSLLAVAQKPV
jgi:SAM-dependent methyltransferase